MIMTVQELIRELSRYSGDSIVKIAYRSQGEDNDPRIKTTDYGVIL